MNTKHDSFAAWQLVTIALVLGSTLTGCADTARYLRSEPVTHFPAKKALALPNEIKDYLQLHCTKAEDIKYEDADATNSQCLYISADASLLGSATLDKTKRDQIIRTLLSISDMNCSTFLHRAFANRAAFDSGKKFFQDITTVLSAGTASATPSVSSGLDVTNLLIGKSVDTFNATYYFDKTFQAMEAAIIAERAQRKAYITARQASNSYLIGDALSDIRAYDDGCSIKAGLSRLINVAEKGKDESEQKKLAVEVAEDAKKLTTYQTQFK